MSLHQLQQAVAGMDPEEALAAMTTAIKGLLPSLDEATRVNFLVNLLGGAGDDKVGSLVHL